MGRWLPEFGDSETWWDVATRVDRRDEFVYNREGPGGGPADGTRFVHGSAGPSGGQAVYDRVHAIAFYEQGCCSWNDVVAAAGVPAPPKDVPARNLLGLSTVRGVRLWLTEAEVMKIYGRATLEPVAGHPGVSVLPYTTWPPRKSIASVHSPCGQFENFFFRANRVILIQLGNGC